MEKFINNMIQYEENIFYLKLSLNNIKKAHLLNINRELFQKKIKDDLIFIHKTSQVLLEHLLENQKLITKDEHLHSIHNLKDLYIIEINSLIKNKFIKRNDFSDIIETNRMDMNKIEEILEKINKELNKEDLTTNEELNILFMEDNMDEKE